MISYCYASQSNMSISPQKQARILTKKKTTPLVSWRGNCYVSVLRRNCTRSFVFLSRSQMSACTRQFFLSTGVLAHTRLDYEACSTSCPICTRRWHEVFIPVYCTSVVSFIEFLMITGKLPAEVDYKNPVSSLLAESTFWKETVFDKNFLSVSRINVDAFFLSRQWDT